MIPVTDLLDRQETRIGHLGKDGAIALPRAVRASVLGAVVLGAIFGMVLFAAVASGGWLWGGILGGAVGWVLIGWSPDEISENVPRWALRRLGARRNRIDLPCLGAGTRPEYTVPKGGRCARCDKDQPLDDRGLILSCGLTARVYIGLAPLPEVTAGTTVTLGGDLEIDAGDGGDDLGSFTQREL